MSSSELIVEAIMALCTDWKVMKPGDWMVVTYTMELGFHSVDNVAEATHFVVRDPHGGMSRLAIRGKATQENGSSWVWNESFEKPTLHPSIWDQVTGGYHGWLTNGEWSPGL